MADRKISELVALTTPAAGDYLPIIDISEAAAVSKNKRITIEELLRGAPDGTAAAPSIAFESDGGNGLYLAATDTIGISTNGVSRATISTTAITSALPIALSGSTSGSVTLTPVAVAGTTTITLPATTGTVVTTGDTGTVTSTMIADGTILDADVNASAAIAGTKISPDFGSQNTTTTGTSTAASFSPTSSTVPTNGFYLGATNNVNLATNGVSRISVGTAAISFGISFRASTGTAAAPSISFSASNNSGFYYTGTTNEIAASTAGVERQRWGANGLHTFNSAAHSGSALTTTAPAKIYSSTGTYTDTATAASGTVTHGPIVAFDNPAIAATNVTVTYTNASTVYIDGAPTASTNVTITNPYALYVNAGQTSVPLASAASPAIVFGTDTNTGIWSPAADTFALATNGTEGLRLTSDQVICYSQPTPASYGAAATLTVADLKTGIIQYTGAAATLTLPTGTLTEGGFSSVYTNMAFEWSLINTGTGLATVGAGTNHTIVGLATCAQNNSARFATRRTAANTYVSYRIS